jgi:high-affinity K+ transport system ATPase subunit B
MFSTLTEAVPPHPDGPRWAIVRHAMRALRPSRLWHHPPLFVLETVAALLSLLALRDAFTGAGDLRAMTSCAAGLWGALLLANTARTVWIQRKWSGRRPRSQDPV